MLRLSVFLEDISISDTGKKYVQAQNKQRLKTNETANKSDIGQCMESFSTFGCY